MTDRNDDISLVSIEVYDYTRDAGKLDALVYVISKHGNIYYISHRDNPVIFTSVAKEIKLLNHGGLSAIADAIYKYAYIFTTALLESQYGSFNTCLVDVLSGELDSKRVSLGIYVHRTGGPIGYDAFFLPYVPVHYDVHSNIDFMDNYDLVLTFEEQIALSKKAIEYVDGLYRQVLYPFVTLSERYIRALGISMGDNDNSGLLRPMDERVGS